MLASIVLSCKVSNSNPSSVHSEKAPVSEMDSSFSVHRDMSLYVAEEQSGVLVAVVDWSLATRCICLQMELLISASAQLHMNYIPNNVLSNYVGMCSESVSQNKCW